MDRVAVVTGGNRGLGFAIVKKLCESFHGIVILTARDEKAGIAACNNLKESGLEADFCKVDVTDQKTVEELGTYIHNTYGGVDVLINNAGIYHGSTSTTPYAEQVSTNVDCDYFGLRRICDRIFPLLKPHARVVNISSRMGKYSVLGYPMLDRLASAPLTPGYLDELMLKFKSDVLNNVHAKEGWPDESLINDWQNSAYCVTKLFVTLLTKLQANYFKHRSEKNTQGILVNACCPGWLSTRLGGPNAPLTPEQGADTPLYLALLAPEVQSPNGKLLFERKIVPFIKAPSVRLPAVTGREERQNDVVFFGTEAQQHVIFFPGDVQDYIENMSSHHGNKAWSKWNLEATAKLIGRRFPNSFVWIVKPSRMHQGTYACYDNFVETSVFGVPDHGTKVGAISHLRKLLESSVRKVLDLDVTEEDVTESFPITLVGFSHGCVVLNQIVHELPEIITSQKAGLLRFVSRINTIHWLDAGHCGQSSTWVTDERLLGTLTQMISRVRAHVTPYQVCDKSRAWIGQEHAQFKAVLESQGADVKSRLYFKDELPSLNHHFKLLEDFDAKL